MNQYVSVLQDKGDIRVSTFDDLPSMLDDTAEFLRHTYGEDAEIYVSNGDYSYFPNEALKQAIAEKDPEGIVAALNCYADNYDFEWTFYNADHGYNKSVIMF